MPRNVRLISYSAVAAATFAGGVGTAGAALAGDSLSIEDTSGPSRIIHWWQLGQTAGAVKLTHSRGHDNTNGLTMQVAAGDLGNLLNRGLDYHVYPNEDLSLRVYGTAVAGDVTTGCLLIERELSGLSGNYIDFETLRKRRDPSRQTNINVDLVAAAAAGYGVEAALSAVNDYLWGDMEYAFLGATAVNNLAAVVIRGADTGGVKIGCPVNAVDAWPRGNDFFPELARVFNDKMIPVIKANNRKATFVSGIFDENLATAPVTLHFAMLR